MLNLPAALLNPPVTFDRPLWLLGLPLAGAYFALVSRRSRAALPIRPQRLALAVRLGAAALLLLALAGTHTVRRTDRQATLFVLDVSQSINPNARARSLRYVADAVRGMGRGDEAGVVTFGRTPALDVPLSPAPDLAAIQGTEAGDATDLAAALRLAEGTFPPTLAKKIVVLSDGGETRGDAQAEADALRLSGVRVEIAPTDLGEAGGPAQSPEALIASVQTPAEAALDAPFALHIALQSTTAQTALLTVTRDGKPFARRQVSLSAGATDITLSDRLAQPGLHHYEAQLAPAQDSITQNNHAFADTLVHDSPRVLYLTDAPAASALPPILRAQGLTVDTKTPAQCPAQASALTAYDAVVLSDVPADGFAPAQQQALRLAVQTFGVGLGMMGGTQSFGAGGWDGSPIEAALPIRMAVPQTRRMPSAAVVVVLDASGSMAQTEDGVEKVQLGARAAVQLMSSLQPADQVAVTSVTTETTVVMPLQPASRVVQARAAIEDVHAGGGGIYCRQGLEDAYALLLNSHAAIKHVILVADTSDSEQQENCVAEAADARRRYQITTTVCGIGRGTDSDAPFQRALAHAGGGQWSAVGEAADLPSLFRRDVQTLKQSWYTETPARAVPTGFDPVLRGLDFAGAPALLGHNLATPRPGASVALRAGPTDPLLVHGQSGLGRAFAFLGDDRPHWASQWLRWPQAPQFYAQTVRSVLRTAPPASFTAAVDGAGGRGQLTIDALTDARAGSLHATLVAPDLSTSPLALTPSGAGRMAAGFQADQPGTYLVSVRQAGPGGGQKTLRLPVPYAPEYATLGPNLPLLMSLADVTGGRLQPDPARVFRDRAEAVLGDQSLAPVLLLLAACLLVGDIAVRRLALHLPALGRFARVQVPQMARQTASKARAAAFPSPAPVATRQVADLLSRPLASRAPSEMPAPGYPAPAGSTPASAPLARRAPPDDDDDNPFPQVASLRPRPAPRRTDD